MVGSSTDRACTTTNVSAAVGSVTTTNSWILGLYHSSPWTSESKYSTWMDGWCVCVCVCLCVRQFHEVEAAEWRVDIGVTPRRPQVPVMQRGDAVCRELATKSSSTTPVSLATTGPDSLVWSCEPINGTSTGGRGTHLPNGWRAEEGTPMASCYFLSSSQTFTCAGATSAGPGMRPAISSMEATARETRSQLRSSYGAEWQTTGANRSSQQAGQKRRKRKQDQIPATTLRMKHWKMRITQ